MLSLHRWASEFKRPLEPGPDRDLEHDRCKGDGAHLYAWDHPRAPPVRAPSSNAGDWDWMSMITKVAIRNYRLFRNFDVELDPDVNVIVGDNDTGKSTLVEAINLALTGRLNGRPLIQELTPYLVNLEATADYVKELQSGESAPAPPEIVIDVFLAASTPETEILRGTNNLYGEDACGVRLQAKLSQDFAEEYASFIAEPSAVRLVPTEYYRVDWLGFSGNSVTARSVPALASVIDPATIRLQSGVDYHLQEIIRTYLDPNERVELSRQYRSLREEFGERPAVKTINEHLKADSDALTDRQFSLSIDISRRYTWESSLAAHLDDLPFALIGKGEQNAVKTVLAIGRRAESAHVVLIEEPETHLSFASLRRLMARIEAQCGGKQVIVATHSTFVLNKLGLENLLLLGGGGAMRITDIPSDTVEYFKKLAGYDTLRLVLSKGAFLVEGPSDELVIQRAYKDANGSFPIEDGIDVISVGLAHKRFLDLAVPLHRRVWIVTDNDHKTHEAVEERFAEYLGHDFVTLHTGDNPDLNTLEPQIVDVNDLETLNAVLGTTFTSTEEVTAYMVADKTTAALAIFESVHRISMPPYIADAVKQVHK